MVVMDVGGTISLAVSMQSAPGTFALLLGSGISRSARVPTGWDVVVDLITKLAVLCDGSEPEDPICWFKARGGEPDYSKILDDLTATPGDRRNLLNAYFEPTAEEREEGIKVPARAHRAIAQLVAAEFVRVIITTNFDRLTETAIREAGVEPVVVASSAAAVGAIPLAHSKCTIIKLHGDYLDPDLKNTIDELGVYDPAIDRMLDQVFDEYGLVVCGWSGAWDEALRNAILRAPNRRYGTYWTRVGKLDDRARTIVEQRAATEVVIDGADEFFEDLAGKVQALEDLSMAKPMTTAIAVAQLKRYLPDPTQRIRLHDLVNGEANRVLSLPIIENFNVPEATFGNVAARMREYEAASATLVALLATLAFFADREDHDVLIVETLNRLAHRPVQHSGFSVWINLELYPLTLALYGATIGSVAAGRVDGVARAFRLKVPHPNGALDLSYVASWWNTMPQDVCNFVVAAGGQNRRTPVSDYLHQVLRPVLEQAVPTADFDRIFDDAEFLLGFVCATTHGSGPVGRFVRRRADDSVDLADVVRRHAEALLAAGVCGGASGLYEEALVTYQSGVKDSSGWW